jgi:uncharacterized linocin/CFP29 family protein
MVDIKMLHIHCVTPENIRGKRKRFIKKVKPSDPENKLAIQQDIGEALQKLRDSGKYEYYYVIVEIDRGGKPAYRTVTTKIMF